MLLLLYSPVKPPEIKGSIMLKMIDVLEHNLVQNFSHSLNTHSAQFDVLFRDGILNAPDNALQNTVARFLHKRMRLQRRKHSILRWKIFKTYNPVWP